MVAGLMAMVMVMVGMVGAARVAARLGVGTAVALGAEAKVGRAAGRARVAY